MGALTTLGAKSKTVFLFTEAHKLTLELEAEVAIKKGQPIKLHADGTADIWVPTDGRYKLIGYAYGDAAIGELTTIWSRGYAIIYAISDADQDAGPVKYKSYDDSTDIGGTTGYSKYEAAATDSVCNGWSLNNTAAANELIQVVLMD